MTLNTYAGTRATRVSVQLTNQACYAQNVGVSTTDWVRDQDNRRRPARHVTPTSERHPAFAPKRGTPEYGIWQNQRLASRKEQKRKALRGPIMQVAAEEAKTALAAAMAEHADDLPPLPNVEQAHQIIYTRLEQVWVDACAGEYLVVQAKLAVLKLLCHVLGVDAAVKAIARRNSTQTSASDVVAHMQKLGLVVAASPDDTDCTPHVTIQLDPPRCQKIPLLVVARNSYVAVSPAEFFWRSTFE